MEEDPDIIINGNISPEAEPRTIARRLVDVMEEGKSLEVAAAELGLSEAKLNSKALKEQFKALLIEGTFPAEVQRAIVRASRMKIVGFALEKGLKGEGDPAMIKLALEAGKQAGSDPEVGLSQAPQVTVNIGFEKSRELLDKTESILENVEFEDDEESPPPEAEK